MSTESPVRTWSNLTVSLPDDLLCKLNERGLLEPGAVFATMTVAIRDYDEVMAGIERQRLQAELDGNPWMTDEEIQVEIRAARAERNAK